MMEIDYPDVWLESPGADAATVQTEPISGSETGTPVDALGRNPRTSDSSELSVETRAYRMEYDPLNGRRHRCIMFAGIVILLTIIIMLYLFS